MTTEQTWAALKEAAEKATPGPWEDVDIEGEDGYGRYTAYEVVAPALNDAYNTVADCLNATVAEIHRDEDGQWDERGRLNMAYIALANPRTILALEAEHSSLKAENERLREALEQCQRVLAMLTEPNAIQSSTVQTAWAQAVEAEAQARAALAQEGE